VMVARGVDGLWSLILVNAFGNSCALPPPQCGQCSNIVDIEWRQQTDGTTQFVLMDTLAVTGHARPARASSPAQPSRCYSIDGRLAGAASGGQTGVRITTSRTSGAQLRVLPR
jgi:hypothetical protein